ncbi:MAG: glycoside hydrolase family 30 beta sandwich domain-containing protein [Candidatus Cryptobacteroides sp.]
MKQTYFQEILLLGLFLLTISGCNNPEKEDESGTGNGCGEQTEQVKEVKAWVTNCNGSSLFASSSFDFGKPGSMSPYQVTYDKTQTGPEIDGFGLAITTATAYNLLKMDKEDRTAFLTELFSKDKGVGSSLIRVSIGASDFCLNDEYTWCDSEGLENFAVHEEDKTWLFPVLKEIYAINPDVKIIGSPWSCPKWMKGGGSYGYEGYDAQTLEKDYPHWTSGRLKPSCYEAYAGYFVKWIQTMEAEGFDIHAITMQNEPLNHGNSMSMYMPWRDQRDFIKVLGPAMEKAGLSDVKILLFDHNYNYDGKDDQRNYPLNIYADAEAYRWADGSAWHNYGGNVSELDNISAANPEKDIYFTEASIGEWNYSFQNCLTNDFSSIFLGTLSRGGKGVTLWNLMLDDKKGPYSPHDGSCKTCYGGVTINSSDYKTITKNSHWYDVAHASVALKPGAKRIATKGYEFPSGFEYEMFINPDGSVSVLFCNRTDADQQIVFANNSFTVKYTVPAKSIASLLWQE